MRKSFLDPKRRDVLLKELAHGTVEAAAAKAGVALATAYAWDSRRLRNVCRCGGPIHSGVCHDAPLPGEVRKAIIADRVTLNLTRSELSAKYQLSPDKITDITLGYPYKGRRSPPDNDWSDVELGILRKLYPTSKQEDVVKALPGRPWMGITRKACSIGLTRDRVLPHKRNEIEQRLSGPVLALVARRRYLGLSMTQVVERVSFTRGTLGAYETGVKPSRERLLEWAAALDVTLPPEALEEFKPRNLRVVKEPPFAAVVAQPEPEPESAKVAVEIPEPVKIPLPETKPYKPVPPPFKKTGIDDEIAKFIAARGVTCCPTVYLAPVPGAMREKDIAARLKNVKVTYDATTSTITAFLRAHCKMNVWHRDGRFLIDGVEVTSVEFYERANQERVKRGLTPYRLASSAGGSAAAAPRG